MTLSRSMLHALRDERAPRPAALVAGKRFNVAAIMRKAVAMAHGLRTLGAWRVRMAVALRHVWKLAKAEMAAGHSRDTNTFVPAPREAIRFNPVRRSAEAVRSWSRPVRVNVHGW